MTGQAKGELVMMMNDYIELNMANYDEDQVSQLNAWGIWASHEIERLQTKVNMLAAKEAICDELHTLLDLCQIDGSIHDLDKYTPSNMQSTLGSVLCGLLHRLQNAETELWLLQPRRISNG